MSKVVFAQLKNTGQSSVMGKACEICTSVGATVKKPNDGVNVAQRKKNLGLLTSSYVGHIDCMDVFIKKGADVNCADIDFDVYNRAILCRKMKFAYEANYMRYEPLECFTPLISAAVYNRLEVVQLLGEAGANVNLAKKSRTALGVAAEKGHHKCVELLIELGANVNLTDQTIRPALMCAIHAESTLSHMKCIQILIKAGADVNTIFSNRRGRYTPLLEAAGKSTPQVVSALIKAGADVNMVTGNLFPLLSSVHRYRLKPGTYKISKMLTDSGADVNQVNNKGETALHAALSVFSDGCFNLLLKQGADVNAATNKGITPLMKAVEGCRRLQDMMLERKSAVTIKAEKVRSIKRIDRLLKAGAQIGLRDHLGRNAIEISVTQHQKNVKEIQMLLYAAGETLDGPTVIRRDPYDSAVMSEVEIPQYFKELKRKRDLKHLCREAIRKHLIDLDSHQHLFGRLPQLGLPSIVTEYLLYDCSLESGRAADCENDME